MNNWTQLIRKIEWKSGIYPAEMASFLALCEENGVKTIIESGIGPDAYSTQCLGLYGDLTYTRIVSIDITHPANFPYRDLEKKYDSLEMLTGDSLKLVPEVMRSCRGPRALLIDGPKMHKAVKLAKKMKRLSRVTAIHNCEKTSPWGQEFLSLFDGFHYEDFQAETPDWQEFKKWEAEATKGYHMDGGEYGDRDLKESSLIMSVNKQSEWERRIYQFLHG